MALATLAYSTLQRLGWEKWQRHVLAGAVFGLGAALEMLQPTVLEQGFILDNRSLFVAFAGVFLGPLGAATALSVGIVTRLAIGGAGAPFGVLTMVIAAAIGLIWSHPRLRPERFRLVHHVAMGLTISLSLVTLVFAPDPWLGGTIVQLVGTLVLANVLGSLVFGAALESARHRARFERSLYETIERDFLTGLTNRRGFTRLFGETRRKSFRRGTALLVTDLDHFKRINDTYGHGLGDEVLVAAAQAMRSVVRADDIVARVGGEEFAVLMPDVAEADAARAAERLRTVIEREARPRSRPDIGVTASIGGAHFDDLPELPEAFGAADDRLYAAKNDGRNAIRLVALPGARLQTGT
ncbi:GGDEF domain-containing protein [Tranquillimonas rosea]